MEGLLCAMPASKYCEEMAHIYTKTSVSCMHIYMYMYIGMYVSAYVCA